MDCKIKVSTQYHVILDSGTIILPANEYCEFEIENLRFRFSFFERAEENDQEKKSEITGALVQEGGGSYLSFNIVNFDGPFSTPRRLLEVGTLNGKKLFFSFSVGALVGNDNPSRMFHYTWYTEK